MPSVKSDNIYIEDTKVNKMYLNGALIYQNMFALVFDVDTTEVEMEYTGGTFTAIITANRPWTLTTPEWISASTVSGKSSTTVTFTVGENIGETQRTGNIEVICNGVTKQINVSQKSQIDYSTMYLTFEIVSGGKFALGNFNGYDLRFSIDNGTTWTTIPNGWSGIDVSEGDKIMLKGDNQILGMLGWWPNTAEFVVYGNIMSIITSTGFTTANTVLNNAFENLFSDCGGLTSAENLVLPATTLAERCYSWMFSRCTGLTTAPELPATTLANNCYSLMFYGCTSLNYIKCLATDISAINCTVEWVDSVASTGTFIKNPNMSSWTTGDDGIPSGWTVIDA